MTQFLRAPWTLLSTVATVAILVSACGKGQQAAAPAPAAGNASTSPAVAIVNGTSIPKTDFDAFLKDLLQGKQPPADLTPEQKNQVLDQLITMQLLSAQALKDGLDKDPDVASNIDVIRMHILSDAESQKFLKDKEPTDAELRAEYDTDIAAMDKTEYHARHILVADKDKADAVIKKIKGGAKFEDVAKAESTDNSKTSGGDLGWFTLARMVKPFGDAVKGLKKGEMTSQPVQTQFGWHVIKLEDTRDVTPPPFDQVKAQVTKQLLQKKLQAYVEDMKKSATIEKKL
jgi:peptidyl-prolyl cis-trans isomerase C